jgi:2-keto-4-pentenoate hydratase/2-oxohepta-3-ene-1,7-dioic acid hydratase in catechol pathway
MKWATYRTTDPSDVVDRVGLVVDDVIYGLAPGPRLIDLLGDDGARLERAGEQARRSPAQVLPVAQARLRPVIPNPPAIRDFSSFLEHYRAGIVAIGKRFDDNWFNSPVFYFTNPNALVTDGDVVRIPGNTRQMDYELEVAAVIGRECIDLDPAEAERFIAGYCIFNDWSARDIQYDEMARAPIGPAKGKDSANGLGPFLVTPDELEGVRKDRGYDLTMTASVNGKEYSRGNWASVYWSFGEMVAYASRNARLVPGDIIASGTVGTGCILELSATHGADKFPWLKEGDEVALEVERLGRMSNRIVLGRQPIPLR